MNFVQLFHEMKDFVPVFDTMPTFEEKFIVFYWR